MTGSTNPGAASAARAAELAQRLSTVRERIDRACADAGRPAGGPTLVVVTKFYPASDVLALAALGVRDIGENRDQEAAAKVAELDPQTRAGLQVHFIGQVQTNKAASVARYADVVHSVDRARLVEALEHGGERAGRQLDVLLQVSLDGDTSRGGAVESDLASLAAAVDQARHLRLRGVMAVAPLDWDPDEAFARLASLAADLRADHPGADLISAGMSGDLEAAIRHGATHLRVGTAILGSRPGHG